MDRAHITTPPRLPQTAIAEPLQTDDHRRLYPVNVCRGGVSCTLNTRYDGLSETTDIITLAHFPKTVVLIEYEQNKTTD